MKKFVFIILVLVATVYLVGCGKKQKQTLEEMQEPMSMEALSALSNETQAIPQTQAQEIKTTSSAPPNLESLPPAGPYRPTSVEIQTALKNTGYYTAAIDGKAGPLTKKAIEEFQRANGLQADGKVGPKTWAVLGSYLNPPPIKPVAPVNKKR